MIVAQPKVKKRIGCIGYSRTGFSIRKVSDLTLVYLIGMLGKPKPLA